MNTKLHKKMTDILTSPTEHVEYWTQGSFTIAIVIDAVRVTPKAVGVAKCNLNLDTCNPKLGREIALARAVKKIARKSGR